jgi:hypothetical protein
MKIEFSFDGDVRELHEFFNPMVGSIIGGQMVTNIEVSSRIGKLKREWVGCITTKKILDSHRMAMNINDGMVFECPPLYEELPYPKGVRFCGEKPVQTISHTNAIAGQEPARGIR